MYDDDCAVAARFDQLAQDGFMAEFEPEERPLFEVHLARWAVQPGQRILEPGCGTGRLTELLAARVGISGEVRAFDISNEMIALAQRRHHTAQVSCEVNDGRCLDRPDAYFHQIICFHVFPHFVHQDEVLREFGRVLRADGTLWIAHLMGRAQVNEVHRNAGPPLDTHLLPDDDTLRGVLAASGFSMLDVVEDANGFSVRAVPTGA